MNIQFNVSITNQGLPEKTRVNLINTEISGQARYAAQGTCNFYNGPVLAKKVLTDVLIDAPGFAPYSYFAETGQLIEFGDANVNIVCTLTPSFRIPSREQVIAVKDNFCNLFDADGWPIFTPFISSLFFSDKAKANDWLARLKKAGSTHVTIALSYDYAENLGWAERYPIEGRDFTNDLDSLIQVIVWLRNNGLIINLKLACDGQGYDPVGKTYGWQWGMDNVPAIVRALKAYKPWVIFSSGFDGCFPDWSPEQTVAFIRMLRAVVDEDGTEGYIGTETSGPGTENLSYIHLGHSASDWHNNQLDLLDVFEIEVLNLPLQQEALIEVAQRLLDKTNPAYYRHGNKEQGICFYESCAYQITRKQLTSQDASAFASQAAKEGFVAFGNGLPE